MVTDDPGQVYADSAYRGTRFLNAAREKGGTARVVVTGVWVRSDDDARAKLKAINDPIHAVRRRIKKIFGTWQRSYGARTMVHRGIRKATLQIMLTARL